MINNVIKTLEKKYGLKYKIKNYSYLMKLSFHPKTAIICCMTATAIINLFLGWWMSCIEANTTTYNILLALVTGIIASCLISIVIELSNNYKNNKLACYELGDYYKLILDFERSKYTANRLMKDDEEHQVCDIVQLVWQELPKMAPLLLSTLEHKKMFLSDSEISALTNIKFAYDEIRAEVRTIIEYSLMYNAVNHPDEDYLNSKYYNNILEYLPKCIKEHIATKNCEEAIQKITDIIMSDEFLLEQFMSDYVISVQSMNDYKNEYDETNSGLENMTFSEDEDYDAEYMTEEEHRIFCENLNKYLEQKNKPFVSWYISNLCYKIAQHIEELKSHMVNKPYVGIYLDIMTTVNKRKH